MNQITIDLKLCRGIFDAIAAALADVNWAFGRKALPSLEQALPRVVAFPTRGPIRPKVTGRMQADDAPVCLGHWSPMWEFHIWADTSDACEIIMNRIAAKIDEQHSGFYDLQDADLITDQHYNTCGVALILRCSIEQPVLQSQEPMVIPTKLTERIESYEST